MLRSYGLLLALQAALVWIPGQLLAQLMIWAHCSSHEEEDASQALEVAQYEPLSSNGHDADLSDSASSEDEGNVHVERPDSGADSNAEGALPQPGGAEGALQLLGGPDLPGASAAAVAGERPPPSSLGYR